MQEAEQRTWISKQGYTFIESDEDVFTATTKRISKLYDEYEEVIVSFSGGKDSTCLLMMTLAEARRRGRLPVRVMVCDEEVIDPDTVSYLTEVRNWPEVQMDWLCVPIRHTLSSRTRVCWFPWDPDEKDIWARPMPEWAITTEMLPGFEKGYMGYRDAFTHYYRNLYSTQKIANVTGIRMEEAFNRRRSIMNSKGWLRIAENWGYVYGEAKPIYDWKVTDVWKAILVNGWPHSAYYDRAWMAGVSLRHQRVAPWGNVAGNSEVPLYPSLYPEFWERALRRLPELRAMGRYGGTAFYKQAKQKPEGFTWREWALFLVMQLQNPEAKEFWLHDIANQVKRAIRTTGRPLPETADTMNWKKIAQMVAKNDLILDKGGTLNSRDRM